MSYDVGMNEMDSNFSFDVAFRMILLSTLQEGDKVSVVSWSSFNRYVSRYVHDI